MQATEDRVRAALHDDAYRYAYRRSLSTRLASEVALEAVEALDAGSPATPDPSAGASDGIPGRLPVLATAHAALERYLPPALPPRVQGVPDLQYALASLSPGERELLLLCHWDGLSAGEAARASQQEADLLPVVEAACARLLFPEPASAEAFAAVLSAADPARAVTAEDLAFSTPLAAVAADARTPLGTSEDPDPAFPPGGGHAARTRRSPAIVGGSCLLTLAAFALALVPRPAPGPAQETARLFALADVVAVVVQSRVEPTLINGRIRILRHASVVQVVKGEAARDVLTLDMTGRSSLERPHTRDIFPPHQLMFLVRNADGDLAPIEGNGSVLTLVDRRSPEATTVTGDPVPLPNELREAIRTLPVEELRLATSGEAPGSLDPDAIIGMRPPPGRDAQNLPAHQLGTFHGSARDGEACVWFEFNSRAALLRWPDGFSAYQRVSSLRTGAGDPPDRRVLTVLNERGYPYVDSGRPTPFIRAVPTGERGMCGGREFGVWDIAVAPASTLLYY
ncbi:serine/threonine-protein kinase [Arthrobacter sp. MDB2-24]